MIVKFRERNFIDRFTCIDTEKQFNAISYFVPTGTSLYYFKVNQFSYKTIASEDIISIEL